MLRALYNRALAAGMANYVPGLFARAYTGTRTDVKRAPPPADMGHALTISPSLQQELRETQIWFALLFLLRECLLPTLPGYANATSGTE